MFPRVACSPFLAFFCPLVTAAAPLPPPDGLTEYSAAQWGAQAQNATATVSDDTNRVRVGDASIHFSTDGGSDTWLWAPLEQNAGWDFLAAGAVGPSFWVYAVNENLGFQNSSPWVRLGTSPTDYIEYLAPGEILNDARNRWLHISIPLNGDDTWGRTIIGNPDLADINYVEIHADTWDAGFDLWFDGLAFDVPLSPPPGQVAVAGNQQVSLAWQPFVDPTSSFAQYNIYRATSPFTNVTGMTPIHTISNINTTTYDDTTVVNGTGYYYAVTAMLTGGAETTEVSAVGPRTPRDETDLQIASISRTPRYPRYDPIYTYYEITEPSGFGPYGFTAATGLGSGQHGGTQRFPNVGDPVTFVANVRNRGTNTWSGRLSGTWYVDGSPVSNPSQAVSLAPGETATFEVVRNWDNQSHEIRFGLDIDDARPANNELAVDSRYVPFLTYVDVSYIENFRESPPGHVTNPQTDDMIDWLNRHMARFNELFADAGCDKRVHYDILEVLNDHDPDPTIERINFAIFPFRFRAAGGDIRYSGYYHPDDDIDYGLLHECAHQLGLIDLYRLNLEPSQNLVTGELYRTIPGLMHGVSPLLSQHSALAMNHWLDIAHGYYGQYLYCLPEEVRLRVLDRNGQPLPGASVKMYQKAERPGLGEAVTDQIKAQGITTGGGEWTLPNVPIDHQLVPTTFAGDQLNDNPFGYLAVVGTNGLLLFEVEYGGQVDYAWLDITEVNNACWHGQTASATFERQFELGGELQLYPPADMAELNADNWFGEASGGTITLSDDAGHRQVGQSSLKAVTTSPFDNCIRYPEGILANWDLSEVDDVRIWFYAENPNLGFQHQSPWVRLGHYQDGYFEWVPEGEFLNQAIGQWVEAVIPVGGGMGWIQRTLGTPSLNEIHYLEIYADTWGTGFTLWVDGVGFEPNPQPLLGDLNCDGTLNAFDIGPFVLALTDPAAYQAAYPECDLYNADVNRDGSVNSFDIDPFVELITGG